MSNTDFGAAFSDFGTGIGDLFAASGSQAEATGFTQAAAAERSAAQISASAEQINLAANERKTEQVIGQNEAASGASGLKFSGTEVNVAEDNARQGSISAAITEDNGALETLGHTAAAQRYTADAAQAKAAAAGSGIGGILSIASGIFSIFSDKRLKENIKRVGVGPNGRDVYEFNYLGQRERWRGYFAQDLDMSDVVDAVGFMSPINPQDRSIQVGGS